MSTISAPFPYFGGKSRIAAEVWQRLGNVLNYVEPFTGSAAVLLARPDSHAWWDSIETINDKDGLVSNYWRATQADPDAVAHWADWPVNENDLHARHSWLVHQKDSLQEHLEGDPDYYDAKAAGWWLWGICLWIGSGWCSGNGPWQSVEGKLTHLGDAGLCEEWSEHLRAMMRGLRDRLRRVRVECGDWERVCGDSPTSGLGLTGIFLDPPYSDKVGRANNLYRIEDDSVAHRVREWAIGRGDNPLFRIALCGYEGEHDMPDSWAELAWKTKGGYAGQGDGSNQNGSKERVWFSRYCLPPLQERLL